MEKLMSGAFFQKLQAAGTKLQGNRAISSIMTGMMHAMSLIMIGSICQIICAILDLTGIAPNGSTLYNILYLPYTMTMGIISLFEVFTIAYTYAQKRDQKPVQAGILALVCFLLVCAPATTYTLAGETTVSAMDVSYLGGMGLFVAIIIALLSVDISKFCVDHHFAIKLPDVVPPSMVESFNAIIPGVANIVIWYGLASVISVMTQGQLSLPLVISLVVSIPMNVLNSVPGMFVVILISALAWICGMHGGAVVMMALMPIYIQAYTTNAALAASGQPLEFAPIFLYASAAVAGGTGHTLGLVLLGLRSKSERIRSVSKASLVPGLFCINEPVVFGMPIMYNVVLAIPYILVQLIVAVIALIGYQTGLLALPYVLIMATMPVGVVSYLSSMHISGIIFTLIAVAVSLVVYFPFLKVYEKQCLAAEEEA